jgi:hypothetical protein
MKMQDVEMVQQQRLAMDLNVKDRDYQAFVEQTSPESYMHMEDARDKLWEQLKTDPDEYYRARDRHDTTNGCKVKDAMHRKVQVMVDGNVEVINYTMAHLFKNICDGYLDIDSDLKRRARNAKAKEEDDIRRLRYEQKVAELTQQQVGNQFAVLSEDEEYEDHEMRTMTYLRLPSTTLTSWTNFPPPTKWTRVKKKCC